MIFYDFFQFIVSLFLGT